MRHGGIVNGIRGGAVIVQADFLESGLNLCGHSASEVFAGGVVEKSERSDEAKGCAI